MFEGRLLYLFVRSFLRWANYCGLRNALGTHSVPHWAHGTPKKFDNRRHRF